MYDAAEECASFLTCHAQACHPHSFSDSECPRSPNKVRTCPCGKKTLEDLDIIRTSCKDPLPCCESRCEKPLMDCDHLCAALCKFIDSLSSPNLSLMLFRSSRSLLPLPGGDFSSVSMWRDNSTNSLLETKYKHRIHLQQSLPCASKLWKACLQSSLLPIGPHCEGYKE
jgi:hypothetical protein